MSNQGITESSFARIRSFGGRGQAKHQFAESLRGLAIGGSGNVYAVGDRTVKVFSPTGDLLDQWATERPGFSIAVDHEGQVWVGQAGQVEICHRTAPPEFWRDNTLGPVTAIAFWDDNVFLADASARFIRRYDRRRRWQNAIGDRHRKGGFHIPNGVVDFSVDDGGIVHVANPGMHRVERYRSDGELLGHFGRFDGRDPQGFPGCCNPTNLALDARGRVFVSEKAMPRVKVYDPSGDLLAVLADSGFDPAAKNMDLTVDADGHVYVADTETLRIHVFAPTSEGAFR